MARSFWLGVGAGAAATVAIMATLQLGNRPKDTGMGPPSGSTAVRDLEERLAAAEKELGKSRVSENAAVQERIALQTTVEALEAQLEQAFQQLSRPGALGKLSGLSAFLDRGDFKSAASALSDAHERGLVTALELMQLAVQHPELIVEGVNEYGFPDPFRSILISALSSVDDPIEVISQLYLDKESNQGFSSRIAAFTAQIVDRNTTADSRIVAAIQKLLSGNPMMGEKVRLYPALAQLSAMGDQNALAIVRQHDHGIYSPGIETLLAPPVRDEHGNDLRGAIVHSVQFNKGPWENRPRTLQGGDIVVSIESDRVSSASDFFNLVEKHHDPGRDEFVDAGIFRPLSGAAGQFEYQTVQLDPGDLQLLYGVYSVKRP